MNVRVRANDIDQGGSYWGEIHHHTNSSDEHHDNLTSAPILVQVYDDDEAEILVHPDVVYAAEGDLPTFQYLLALGSQPTAPVTVSCIVDERDASIVPASSYVFDSTNWNIPQFVRGTVNDDVIDDTAHRIADIRVGEEGQEGLSAFLNKRKANWVPEEE